MGQPSNQERFQHRQYDVTPVERPVELSRAADSGQRRAGCQDANTTTPRPFCSGRHAEERVGVGCLQGNVGRAAHKKQPHHELLPDRFRIRGPTREGIVTGPSATRVEVCDRSSNATGHGGGCAGRCGPTFSGCDESGGGRNGSACDPGRAGGTGPAPGRECLPPNSAVGPGP